MGKHFCPKLDPSQVWVAEEYFVAHDLPIPAHMRKSVTEADYQLCVGERVRFALVAAFTVEGDANPGIISVTSHSLRCCSSIMGRIISVCIPYTQAINIGKARGLLSKESEISCDNVSVKVRASGDDIAKLQAELCAAIADFPNKNPISLEPAIFRPNEKTVRKAEQVKSEYKGVRRLSKAESTKFTPCPKCKGTIIVERNGHICCLKCDYQFQ